MHVLVDGKNNRHFLQSLKKVAPIESQSLTDDTM